MLILYCIDLNQLANSLLAESGSAACLAILQKQESLLKKHSDGMLAYADTTAAVAVSSSLV